MAKGIRGEFINVKGDKISVTSPVVMFEQNQTEVIFCPTLEIYGYGKTTTEARDSLKNNLIEFINYTTNKGTFFKELKRMGWQVKKRKKQYSVPSFSKMLRKNEKLVEILDNQNARIEQETFALPA